MADKDKQDEPNIIEFDGQSKKVVEAQAEFAFLRTRVIQLQTNRAHLVRSLKEIDEELSHILPELQGLCVHKQIVQTTRHDDGGRLIGLDKLCEVCGTTEIGGLDHKFKRLTREPYDLISLEEFDERERRLRRLPNPPCFFYVPGE